MRRLILILSFFFQAEDGIRDLYVTGVQTCALPIWSSWLWRRWLQRFAQTAEAISATTKKTEKVRITAEYLKSLPVEEAVIAAVFLAGRAFPAWEETTLQVGGALLWRALQEVAGDGDQEWSAAYRRYGDLGAAARDVFAERRPQRSGAELTLSEVESKFRQTAQARGPAAKLAIVT